jgi:excisionase family DNA binding protein
MSNVSFRISQVCDVTGLGRTSIYKAISEGRLRARKWRRATVVLADDLDAFLRALPAVGGKANGDDDAPASQRGPRK